MNLIKYYISGKSIGLLAALVLLSALLLPGRTVLGGEEAYRREPALTMEEVDKGRIAVWLGGVHERMAREVFPDAHIVGASSPVDMGLLVSQGKADALVMSKPYLDYYAEALSDLAFLGDPIGTVDTVAIFSGASRGQQLQREMNEFIARSRENGLLDELAGIWFGSDKSRQSVDYSRLCKGGEKIRLAICNVNPPYCMYTGSGISGLEMDFFLRFCEDRGYDADINIMDFRAVLATVTSNKADIGLSAIEYDAERNESVLMSDTISTAPVVVMVKAAEKPKKVSFWKRVSDSFTRTFIREDRYKIFLSGTLSTLLITGLAMLLGTFLGFILYSLYERGGRTVRRIIMLLEALSHLVPGLILLMIFYYIVFADIALSGTLVSGISFSILFGLNVFGILLSSIKTVGEGQSEAAYTMGFSPAHAFWKILFPQAVPFFFPAYKKSLVALLMETSVVGYIAITDLTLSGNLIRSITFEPFFPLAAMALIYALLGLAIMAVTDRVRKALDPRNRTVEKILKECTK